MRLFERIVQSLARVVNGVGVSVLVVMMLLAVANIVVRLFYRPILGTNELVAYGLVIVVCFGLAYTALLRGHVSVELLVSRFPQRVQAVVDVITCFLGIGVFSIIAWQSAVYGWERWLIGEYAPVLKFPIIPLRYVLVFGCILVCLALLLNMFKTLAEVVRR